MCRFRVISRQLRVVIRARTQLHADLSCLCLEIVADQHVFGLEVAVKERLAARLLVVEVPEARGDAHGDLEEGLAPVVVELVRGRRHQDVLQRAPSAELEHEAELVRAVAPAPSHEADEIPVRERRHELQLAHELAYYPRGDFSDAASLDGHRVEPEHALPYDAERAVGI